MAGDSKQRIKIFGTDGVRGRANKYPMTVEVALALGRAAGKIFRRHRGKHRVVIGKDTRLSCYMFENALIAGLCSMGIDTLMLGPFPTPGVAFITRAYRADAGIVISASHNPFYDNGIKFFSADGFKLPDEIELQMEELIHTNDFSDSLPGIYEVGKNTKVQDADGRYIEFAKATFPKSMTLNGMKILLDCANGAAYRTAPLIFRELGAEVCVYGNEPDGININEGCGALHPEKLQKAMIDQRADAAIALDGDGDRVVMVDENAQLIDGDMLLAICARDMCERGVLRNNKVVTTIMSNFGFFKAMEQLGVETIQTNVGDRKVIQAMLEHNANLGGEQSGHMIFSDHNTTGDGLVSSLQVLRIMQETGKKLSELAAFMHRYPQTIVNVGVKAKTPLDNLDEVQIAVREVEKELAGQGRVLIRYSGTEMICRVMVEGPELRTVQQMADRIAETIENSVNRKALAKSTN